MGLHILFVVSSFLLDSILMNLFPNNLVGLQLMFLSNIGFSAMVLTVRKFSFIDGAIFAVITGMIYDYVFANSYFVYAIAFLLIACIIHFWSKHMMDTVLESLILCISTIFVKDFVVYFIMYFSGDTMISFKEWFMSREFLTILGNAILVLILVIAIRYKDEVIEMKEHKVRKEEKIEWFKLKSKR